MTDDLAGAAVITVNGETLHALTPGAAYWPERRLLIVSDLHFEKGSHFAGRGVLLPPYDTRATLRRLASLIARLQPETVLSLGDAFHDRGAEARMDDADADALEALTRAARWIWIIGNHDPEPPKRFSGAVEAAFRAGALLFRHEPAAGAAPGEIAGHLHPAARVDAASRIVRRRCFATDGRRLVMPAFGAYAGGLNILDEAFDTLFANERTALTLGRSGVYPFFGAALRPDPPAPAAYPTRLKA